jgi:predicted GH43/DUF377 family glycosyl hydrolase
VLNFKLKRIGTMMEPQVGNPNEVEGVLNPAAIRARDGQLYLFPRLVARGNFSRIGIARVLFDGSGDPTGVERMGIALEPEADYELSGNGGGCEDPRIAYVEPLQHYVMTYTALSRRGPRIAIAISDDLLQWRRLGLATFHPYNGIAFDDVDDKDASVFPALISDPSGQPAVALVHRPLFPGTRPEEKVHQSASCSMDLHRESIWISYCRVSTKGDGHQFGEFVAHHRLACPETAWQRLKIGGGAPPIMCRHGWLLIYHGVHDLPELRQAGRKMCYSAGAMVLSKSTRTGLSIARRNRCLFLMARSSATARSTMSSSPRASIVVMILARPIASTSTTAWPTIGLAWLVCMCPQPCRAV